MTFCSRLFRLAALFLLFSGAVDIIAIDMLGAFWQDRQELQSELQGSCSQDDCFCCSLAAAPVHPVTLTPSLSITAAQPLLITLAPMVSLDPPFHPPRA